ncbi:Bug family tripartite tricarboxylate transporter substrate binding protein [Paraburkholderia dioscoreae]|uniref:Tripartite tricarboxylate transporter(TTT) family, periplasmic ligand binding protein TctC n=1 Tax=Paraburkholderia dioscoreae TaxID=2604047 RepID=A0A5Q4YVQ4_9BURK|nr:tripartite tricarboxylate transporter substrate binding protein [Paraburkholderia dioscoreae]VVD32275.1 Putative tripartite tricarboxylate transporter(TTT) family, periplasmic ligand binding protein TctC [Paraburkholderia dioscoreae]
MVSRRQFVASLGATALAAWPARYAMAAYPESPIRFVIPFPGGTQEAQARLLAKSLGKYIGQPVIVEAHPGAGGNIGAAYVAKARGDGYTMLLGVSTFFETNPLIYKDIGYKLSDLTPVSLLSEQPFLLVSRPTLPVSNVPDLIRYAKQNPGKITVATAGPGSPLDLANRQFMAHAGVTTTPVPYKGGGEDTMAVMSGFTDLEFGGIPNVVGNIHAGKLRALGITGSRRLASLPDIPTIAEAGLPGFDFSVWSCLSVPSTTPAPIIQQLNAAVIKTIADPEVRNGFAQLNLIPVSSSSEAVVQRIASETAQWRSIFDKSGFKQM